MANKLNRPTLATVKADLAEHGLTISRKEGEYRVAIAHGTPSEKEASAYYTNDIDDAWGTGLEMARHAAKSQAKHIARFGRSF